jgi:hypothetical protein
MAALVQTIPQQTSTVLLQTRPSSSSGASSFASSSQVTSQQNPRSQAMSLGTFGSGASSGAYRGHQAIPVAPYAFTSTPGLVNTGNGQQRQSSAAQSRSEAPVLPSIFESQQKTATGRLHHPSTGSLSSPNSSQRSYVTQDDSILSAKNRLNDLAFRPLSTVNLPSSTPFLNIPSPTGSAKPSPDRYRRGNRRGENATSGHPALLPGGSNGSGPTPTRSSPATEESPNSTNTSSSSLPSLSAGGHAPKHVRVPSADDSRPEKPQHPELAKRYRRRSWASMDAAGPLIADERMPLDTPLFAPLSDMNVSQASSSSPHPTDPSNGSTESIHSAASSTVSVKLFSGEKWG